MKRVLIAGCLASLALFSCKKNDSSCPRTVEGIAGTYSLTKVESGAGGSYEDVTSSYVEDCERDDKLSLNSDGTWVYTDAGTVCSPSGNDSGNWSIDSNGKLDIGGVGSFILNDLTITSYDCTTLVAEADYGTIGGVTLKLRFTMRK